MKKKVWLGLLTVVAIAACNKKETPAYFLSPTEGSNVSIGNKISLKLDAPAFDSVQFLVDTTYLGSKKDTSSFEVSTDKWPLGVRILTAKVYAGGQAKEVTTNIVLLPSEAPTQLSYSIVNSFPHDTSSFVEGLEYHDGIFYESDGLKGESSLRKVDPKSGKILKKIDIDARYFAEGITVIGDKIIQLTYQEGVGFVYDKNTLNKLKEFPYTAGREGWGLAFDGQHILNTDGTNNIYFLNKDTYQKERTLEVYDNKGPVTQLNELEFIDGKIYANVWQTDKIVIINPQTGVVESEVDLTNLYPGLERIEGDNVLNGIAWDAAGKRLFVTGKRWDKLFEIKLK